MTDLDPAKAKRLLETTDGKELFKYIAQQLHSIDSVSDIKPTDPVEVAVEVRARAIATEKLQNILGALVSGTEGTQPKDGSDNEFAM